MYKQLVLPYRGFQITVSVSLKPIDYKTNKDKECSPYSVLYKAEYNNTSSGEVILLDKDHEKLKNKIDEYWLKESPKRKIIQINANKKGDIVALCDDGTLWRQTQEPEDWEKIEFPYTVIKEKYLKEKN